jgi:predicted aconitase with swiveling domain
MKIIQGKPVVPGESRGRALVSRVPLSFWGGVDPHTGEVIDVHHDLSGQVITRKALLIPSGRGSCSGSGIMLEMIRQKTCPNILISIEAEPIISLGSVLGYELYKRGVPIVAALMISCEPP